MTQLCNRCELLFQECRPLLGAVCGAVPAGSARTGCPPRPLQEDERRLPKALASTQHAKRYAEQAAAAIVRDHRSEEVRLVSVVAIDIDPEAPDANA